MAEIVYKPTGVIDERMAFLFKECFPLEPFSAEQYAGACSKRLWIAYEGDDMVGFAFVSETAGHMRLNNLGVLPQWRGRGIGTALLDAVVAHAGACGAEALTLSVQTDNAPALRLYRGAGFVATGERCRFRVPYLQLIMEQAPTTALRATAADILGERFRVLFADGALTIGGCSYNAQYPGCSGYTLANPEKYLIDSLLALSALIGEPELLYLVTDGDTALKCKTAGFPADYELYEMELGSLD